MKSISTLVESFARGHASSHEVTENTLDAIDASTLNSFITVDWEGALAQAAECDRVAKQGATLGLLHGLPVAIKDLIDVVGLPTTMGSQQFLGNIAKRDSKVVANLRAAGAVIVGKTNAHEFAYGSSGDRSYFGPVRNPRDGDRMSGGSSSGSAAAVGAGICLAAIGTDTSASVRLPAALCGVVGMKPTFDLISRDGAFPLSGTLDHVGPITANVSDNALMLDVLAGSGSKYRRLIGKSIAGLKVGVPNAFYCEYLAPEVRRCLIDASEAFRQAGATVVVADVPRIYDIYRAQQLITRTEAYALHEQPIKEGRPFSEEVLTRLKSGADVTAAQYLSALRERDVARAAFDAVLEDVDVLLTATCGVTAPLLEERTTKILGEAHPTVWVLTRLTAPTNLSGHPSLSVPFGVVDHLPIGMQLIGRYDEEATLYQLASHLEQAHSHSI